MAKTSRRGSSNWRAEVRVFDAPAQAPLAGRRLRTVAGVEVFGPKLESAAEAAAEQQPEPAPAPAAVRPRKAPASRRPRPPRTRQGD